MSTMQFTVVLLPEADGGYSVICAALPGCVSQGDNREEALDNIKDAAKGWLESWLKHGNTMPVETPEIVAEEIRECLSYLAEDGLPLVLETSEIELPSPVAA